MADPEPHSGHADARGFTYVSGEAEKVSDELLDLATGEAVADQVACGIDIPSDGEQRRENYIHYHCRHMRGFDFDLLTTKVHRNGAAVADLPTITGKIECDSAELLFDGNVLTKATVTGRPATFTLQRAGSDDVTYAEAGKLLYDVQNGVIEFSEQATITESGNEISSSYLMYDINERRINADSSGVDDDRVRITYTPTDSAVEDEVPVEDGDR